MKYIHILSSIIFCCCNNNQQAGIIKAADSSQSVSLATPINVDAAQKEALSKKWVLKDFYSAEWELEKLTDSIYNSLNSKEKAAQMIMSATSEYYGIGLPFNKLLALYHNKIIGSVLFLKGRKTVFAQQIILINKTSKTQNIFPAVFACDCEPALFHKKFTDADSLSPANQQHTIEDVQRISIVIAAEMKRMGLHWNFAPVADLSVNKEIIDNRSFGNKNSEVVEKSGMFIKTFTANNIATSVKHFPGHGVVKGDSHKKLVYIDSAFEEVENFAAIIQQANPISVMTGHIAVNNNPGMNTNGIPATLSGKIVNTLLKDSLHFKGIVVTDAMNMKAVKNFEDADFRAVMAGNDLILIPDNPEALNKKIVIQLNRKDNKSISTSIKKIIRLKICLGIIAN